MDKPYKINVDKISEGRKCLCLSLRKGTLHEDIHFFHLWSLVKKLKMEQSKRQRRSSLISQSRYFPSYFNFLKNALNPSFHSFHFI